MDPQIARFESETDARSFMRTHDLPGLPQHGKGWIVVLFFEGRNYAACVDGESMALLVDW